MGRWQAGLEKKQAFLGRIVDIGAELFAIASACVYANTIKTERPERAEEAYELADLFCQQARCARRRLFDALWSNDDDADYKAAQAVLDGRYTWIEEGIVDPSGDGPMIASQPDSSTTAPRHLTLRDARGTLPLPAPKPVPKPRRTSPGRSCAAARRSSTSGCRPAGARFGEGARADPHAAREVARAAEPAQRARRAARPPRRAAPPARPPPRAGSA